MISKKAQQEIIVTILLVLVALGAVAFVGTFIMKNVKDSAGSAEDKQACLQVQFDLSAISNNTQIAVKRTGTGSVVLNDTKVYVNEEMKNSTEKNIGAGESATLSIPGLKTGDKVSAAAILASGYACGSTGEITI